MSLQVRCLAFATAALLLLTGCADSDEDADAAAGSSASVPGSSPTPTSETRRIDSALGDVEIPSDPQRVAVLSLAAVSVAEQVGVTPVAAVKHSSETDEDPKFDGVEEILDFSSPDLEALVAADPDLIITDSYDGELQPATEDVLTEIAPVAAFAFSGSGQWQDYGLFYADAMGELPAYEDLLSDYEAEVAQLRETVEEAEDLPEVSIVRVYADSLGLYVKSSFPGTVVEDAGFSQVASQDTDDAATVAGDAESYTIQYLVSLERAELADGDMMFLWGYEDNPEAADFRDEIVASSLWQTLDAVQNEHVYQVGDHWIGSGLDEAEAVLADLAEAFEDWQAGTGE